VIRGLVSHAVAILASVATLTVLPTVGYALLAALSLATAGGGGRPLNVILVPAASFVAGAAITLLSCVVTLVIQWARTKNPITVWIPILFSLALGAALGSLLDLLRGTGHPLRVAVLGAALVGLAFNAYWIPFSIASALLSRRGGGRGRPREVP
jgi:hypothetical protein